MTPSHACSDPEFLSNVDGIGALPPLLRLLARGNPVDLGDLAEVAGVAGAALARVVAAQPGAEWDSEGHLVGFGLTSNPTDHRFSIAGRVFYTWCASDTLLFTVILDKPTVAESTCPTTGQQIRLELTPDAVISVTPPGAVVSQRHRQDLVDNLRSDICDRGHFFSSPDAAASWLATNPHGDVRSITEAFTECRAACEHLGWLTSTEAT